MIGAFFAQVGGGGAGFGERRQNGRPFGRLKKCRGSPAGRDRWTQQTSVGTRAERARIAAKSLMTGVTVADFASGHGTTRWQIYDWRKQIDGLSLAAQEMFGLDPFYWAVFVFRSKRAYRMKMLIWDQTGMVLVHKRLEDGQFVWPQVRDGMMLMSCVQLAALFEGLDWRGPGNKGRPQSKGAAALCGEKSAGRVGGLGAPPRGPAVDGGQTTSGEAGAR